MAWCCFIQREPTWSHHTDLSKEIYALSWQPGSDEPQLWKCLSEQKKSHFSLCMNSATAEWFACDAQPWYDNKKAFLEDVQAYLASHDRDASAARSSSHCLAISQLLTLLPPTFWKSVGLLLCVIPGLLLESFCCFNWDGTNLLSFML